MSRITNSSRVLVSAAVTGLCLGEERPFISWQILSPFPTRQCSPDVLSRSCMVEVFLEMDTAHIVGLGAVGRGLARPVSRPGGFQWWRKLLQCEKDFPHKGDRRTRTVWPGGPLLGPQHRPCVMGLVICLRLGGCRSICRTEAVAVACHKAWQSDGHIPGHLPFGSEDLPCSNEC